jgi:hypothetical protein
MGSLGGFRDLLEEPGALLELVEDGFGKRVAREALLAEAGEVVEADRRLRCLVEGVADVGAAQRFDLERGIAQGRDAILIGGQVEGAQALQGATLPEGGSRELR